MIKHGEIMGEPIQAVYLFGAAYALHGIGLTAARRRDAGELRFHRRGTGQHYTLQHVKTLYLRTHYTV